MFGLGWSRKTIARIFVRIVFFLPLAAWIQSTPACSITTSQSAAAIIVTRNTATGRHDPGGLYQSYFTR